MSRKCNGTSKRTGRPCGQTPPPGAVCCKWHGGEAPQTKAKAAERLLEAEARRLLDEMNIEPVTNPVPALQEIAGEVRAFLAVARGQVAQLERVDTTSADGVEHVKAALTVYERALDRAHKILSDMVKLNLAERVVALDEKTAAQLIDLFRAVRDDVELGLTPAQKLGFFPAVTRARAALN